MMRSLAPYVAIGRSSAVSEGMSHAKNCVKLVRAGKVSVVALTEPMLISPLVNFGNDIVVIGAGIPPGDPNSNSPDVQFGTFIDVKALLPSNNSPSFSCGNDNVDSCGANS